MARRIATWRPGPVRPRTTVTFEFVPPEAMAIVDDWARSVRLRRVDDQTMVFTGSEVDDTELETLATTAPVAFTSFTSLDDGMPGLMALAAPGHWWSGMAADGQPVLTAEAWRSLRDDPATSYSDEVKLDQVDELLGATVWEEVQRWREALWLDGTATDNAWVLARRLLIGRDRNRGAVQVAVAGTGQPGARAWRAPVYEMPVDIGEGARALLVLDERRWWALDLSNIDNATDPLTMEVSCRQIALGQFPEPAPEATQEPV